MKNEICTIDNEQKAPGQIAVAFWREIFQTGRQPSFDVPSIEHLSNKLHQLPKG